MADGHQTGKVLRRQFGRQIGSPLLGRKPPVFIRVQLPVAAQVLEDLSPLTQ